MVLSYIDMTHFKWLPSYVVQVFLNNVTKSDTSMNMRVVVILGQRKWGSGLPNCVVVKGKEKRSRLLRPSRLPSSII